MTLPLTKKDLIRFTPARDDAPTYLIGVPTIAGRANFNRRMQEEGTDFISDNDLLDIVKEGVKETLPESQQEEIFTLIETLKAIPAKERPLELVQQVTAIEAQIRPLYPPYAVATAARRYHMDIMPVIAAQCFLRGIEKGVKFQAKAGVVTDECLENISEEDVRAIGWEVIALLHPSESQIKNSGSPLQSAASPETLTAEK